MSNSRQACSVRFDLTILDTICPIHAGVTYFDLTVLDTICQIHSEVKAFDLTVIDTISQIQAARDILFNSY